MKFSLSTTKYYDKIRWTGVVIFDDDRSHFDESRKFMKFCAKKCKPLKREQFSKEVAIVKYLPETLFLDKDLFYEKSRVRET